LRISACQALPTARKTALAAAALAASVVLPAAGGELQPAQLELEVLPAERAGEVVRVVALDRNVPQAMTGKTVKIREVAGRAAEGRPGVWLVGPLKPGRYDLEVHTRTGRFEGYALRPEERSDQELTDNDRARISEIFENLKTFENRKRILDLGGNGRQAVALVELLRTEKTTYEGRAPDAVIWRVECWRFDKLYGAWTKGAGAQVLRRFMVPRKEFETWNWSFVPELGGLDMTAAENRRLQWKLPERFDPARGPAAAGVRGPPEAAPRKQGENDKAQ
jgi:hypothetical protein